MYINDLPLVDTDDEKCLLFADDIAYIQSYAYKIKGKSIPDANELATQKAQIYLNQLEIWMNRWYLTLAPRKCAHLVFSKAANIANDKLDIRIYNEPIPFDVKPKFLGIVFDARLSFKEHNALIKEKVRDRINILKILSFDKHWALPEKFLVNIYKVLVRSVMDYSSIVTTAANKKVIRDLEVLQNEALRVIFKVSLMDHVTTEELLNRAEITSIEERHEELTSKYYEKIFIKNNPLIKSLFESYSKFKKRKLINEDQAIDESGTVDLERLNLIRSTNKKFLEEETHSTILCGAKSFIKDFIIDLGNIDPIGTASVDSLLLAWVPIFSRLLVNK